MSPDTGHESDQTTTLAFHKIQSKISYGSTNYSPGRFWRLVDRLESSGRPIRLSFDDGYAHLLDILPKLVDRLSAPPLVFVPTAWIGRPNRWDYSSYLRSERHLASQEIKQLAALGVEFGSHGHNHRDLTALDQTQLQLELTESKTILRQLTGRPVTVISYPFGRSTMAVRQAAGKAGYERGFTMSFPTETDAALTQGRIPVYTFDSSDESF